ncbi:ShlB/FhaC/HecB family hemolysin secretion/activation protein [Burkholderia ubonensis]|uniref:ShlB/FhaC/HecB family hemolysin secretion/activation protein n=1 Tax=Burkholderia ubonensis TaxID=101571 RepID=UPI0018DF08A6|nr:ShlB/FhaC/HecB family hemolysin secretion/activation protein [Burkholderia ubonensis]
MQQKKERRDSINKELRQFKTPPAAISVYSPETNGDGEIEQVRVDKILFADDPVAAVALADQLRAFEHVTLDGRRVLELLKLINSYYYKSGFVTTFASVEKQSLTSGELVISTKWGKIKGWLDGNGLPAKGALLRKVSFAMPWLIGRVLNVHDVDQIVENLKGNESKEVSIDIVPTDEIGYSYLKVSLRNKIPWKFSVNLDNSGQGASNSGLYKLSVAFTTFDLLGFNETLSINGADNYYDHPGEYSKFLWGGMLSMPMGGWILEAGYRRSDYRALINGIYGDYMSNGSVEDVYAKISDTVARWGDGKVSLFLRVDRKDTENFIDDYRLDVSSNIVTEMSGGVSYSGVVFGGAAYGDAYVSKSIYALGAADATQYFGNFVNFRYNKINLNLNWLYDFSFMNRLLNYSLAGGAQYSDDNLPTAAKLTLGDEYTVRGFKAQSLLGDRGIYLSNTVSMPFSWEAGGLSFKATGFIGLDAGEAGDAHRAYRTLMGCAAGWRFGVGKNINSSITVGYPLIVPENFARSMVFYMNVGFVM